MIATIAVGIEDRPASAPQTDTPWASNWKAVGNPSFPEAMGAVSNLLFAYSGTPGFFSIVSEMRNPRKYSAAVLCCQAGVTIIYTVIGCVIYYYCGSYVASPALGSTGGLVKKIAYGFALPGLMVTRTIVTHVSIAAKSTLYVTNSSSDPCEVRVCSYPARLPTSDQQFPNTLDLLA